MLLRKSFIAAALFCVAVAAYGQSAIVRGEASAGVYQNIKTDGAQNLSVVMGASTTTLDPCLSPAVAKSFTVINISSATTTALVAVSGTTVVYVCSFSVTISEVITTANTLTFEQGTGVACASSPTALTGPFGAGGISASAPIVVAMGTGATLFKTAAGGGLCALTAIGATGAFAGVLSYVQQ